MKIYESVINDKSETSFPEKFLYHVWDEQHIKYKDYKKKILKSNSGKDIKIHFQGHFNTMSGADFKNAIIEINKKNYTGDVEIHINSSDWYNHQHDNNYAYNTVVLHVVLNHNNHRNITINENGGKIEILELKNIISEDIEKLFRRYSATDYKFTERYCTLFSSLRPEFLEKLLIKSGMERLEKKINRFKAELSFVSIDQLFYQSILEALGYSKNKTQFYLFSKDYKWLGFKQQFGNRNNPASLHDFVDDLVFKAEFDTNKYGWYLFRIRPCNHPRTRLYQIAPFIFDSFETSMTTEIVKLFSFTQDNFSIKNFKKRLLDKLSKANSFTKHRLGQDRIYAIVINIFIPILIIYANKNNDSELSRLCYTIYNDFQGLETNNISTIMQKYMSEEQFAISEKKAINQQGILNIYHKFCINNLCKMCKENILSFINQIGE